MAKAVEKKTVKKASPLLGKTDTKVTKKVANNSAAAVKGAAEGQVDDNELVDAVEDDEDQDGVHNEEGTEEEDADEADEAPAKPVKKTGSKILNMDQEIRSDIENARHALSQEEQVHFMIPLAEGEKPGATEELWTNGFKTVVPKGTMCVIPKSLADRLAEKYHVQATAGQEFRLDLHGDKAARLG